jgi:hypothetical protein
MIRVTLLLLLTLTAETALAACDSSNRALVCELSNYNPEAGADPTGTCPARSDFVTAIRDAVAVAPNLRDEVCRLTGLFVVTDGNVSWGVWQNPRSNQTPGGKKPATYVGIASTLIGSTLSAHLDATLKAVLKNPNAPVQHSTATLSDANSKKLAVAAVLAHEIGHIKWHRDNIYSSLPCFYDRFIFNEAAASNKERSWKRDDGLTASVARAFHPGPSHSDPSGGADHDRGVPHPKQGLTPPQVRAVYTGGFASAFASLSPEGDFVETYVLRVLQKATVSFPLTLNFPGAELGPIDVIGNRSFPLPEKLECISPLAPLAATRRGGSRKRK